MSPAVIWGVAGAYLLLLFAVAYYGDWRARRGRSLTGNAWVYALSLSVYCSAWTYFGSVGRAAQSGVWFLPIYLGPTLAMVLAWLVVRKMIRIAHTYRITSIADFVASRYGKSPWLAGTVTLITLVGIVPYIALQLKGVAVAYAVLSDAAATPPASAAVDWWQDSTFFVALALAGFTMVFGARQIDSAERHEGMVLAIALESIVKLVAFLAVGVFVTWGVFAGPLDLWQRVQQQPALSSLLTPSNADFSHPQWWALVWLAMLSVVLLPRQFQVMVVENINEQHLRRATWVFPLYLLLINLFVLPIALGGMLTLGSTGAQAETFVLSLPMHEGQAALALLAFIGGVSAATGMVIVESIAVSTMVCNDLVVPMLLRTRLHQRTQAWDMTGWLLHIRRASILLVLMLGYVYYRVAGEAYALVSIGLISFAAVAQFAPALFGGMYWRDGTARGAMAGLVTGFAVWVYTLMLPSLAKSGWLDPAFMQGGPAGLVWLKPEALLGLTGLDNLTHALFWSLLLNVGAYVVVSLWGGAPSARETGQALLFVDVFERPVQGEPVFWRGQASLAALQSLMERFLGPKRTQTLLAQYREQRGLTAQQAWSVDPAWVQWVETQLAGAIGSASARVMVASVVDEEPLHLGDVMGILEEATQLRQANEHLKSVDKLKDDFMSSVTHELRTPLTSIRALTEIMRDDPDMPEAQRQQFLNVVVAEAERLTRLVNQVLDLAKIESGHAQWHHTEVDVTALLLQASQTVSEWLHAKEVSLRLALPDGPVIVHADADRLTQVVLNLLSNAAKFVPEHTGQIVLSACIRGDSVEVSVQDNGPGIAQEQQALIFEKFRQGDAGQDQAQGTGLGLPISRQIVQHLGGRMWVESMPGQGARFVFTLPLPSDPNPATYPRLEETPTP